MDIPLLSIIPAYNRTQLIGDTLDNVLAQAYDNWECIIIDNGSLDNKDELMDFYRQCNSRIEYYHRPTE